jgi:general secretion pathway protein E
MEFLVMNDEVAPRGDAPCRHGRDRDSSRAADGMRTMYEDGLAKALAGETTIEEVLRVTEEG